MASDNKEKKANWFVRTGHAIAKFFREIRMELKKVVWMKPKQVVTATIAVIMACVLVGVVVWLVDFGMSALYKVIFG